MATILCVDSDQFLTDMLRYVLERERFKVLLAHKGREALGVVQAESVDLMLLGVDLPDLSGMRVLTTLRTFSQVPVVILAAHLADEDIINGFSQGADDFVLKPFNPQILTHRIAAILRRIKPLREPLPHAGKRYYVNGLVFDSGLNEIVGHDLRVRLTPTEGHILHLLFLNEGQFLSARYIRERIWGYGDDGDVNVIKTHIRRMRQKLIALPNDPHPIHTKPGVGYMALQTDSIGKPLIRHAS